MSTTTSVASRLEGVRPKLTRTVYARTTVITILLAVSYGPVLTKLVGDWWREPDFAHGFLVPPFALYLTWTKREQLGRLRLQPTWLGVVAVALGVMMLLAGTFGAELLVSRVSFLVVLFGVVLSTAGWNYVQALRFPLAVLALAIPIPALIYAQLTLPLQLTASRMATALFGIFGIPVLRAGNIIQLPTMTLEVAEACSGIRSIVSLFTIAVLYAYFMENSRWRRVVIVLSSIPVAIGANALRILGTGLCIQYWDPDKAEGFFHEFSGWLMFVSSFLCMLAIHRLLRLIKLKRVSA